MIIGQRIRDRRKELGLSVDEVAAELNKDRSTVYRYENSEIEKLPINILDPLAAVLHTTPAYLMGWTDNSVDYESYDGYVPSAFAGNSRAYQKMQQATDEDVKKEAEEEYKKRGTHYQIPLVGTIAAGMPMFAAENIEEYITCDMKARGEYFALRVKGDSMNAARINDGDIVIIRIQPIVENGEIAAVRVDGDTAALKRFYKAGDIVTLVPQSLNSDNKIQTYDTKEVSVEIYGKAIKDIFEVK
ncbi:MAG: S24 family peptidase [Eubacteriales bacterium]